MRNQIPAKSSSQAYERPNRHLSSQPQIPPSQAASRFQTREQMSAAAEGAYGQRTPQHPISFKNLIQ